jgi:hypothetical protein
MINDDELRIPDIEKGVYEHYSGKRYEVIDVALHSETLEPMVVYKPLYEAKAGLWVRPYHMFIEEVAIDGLKKLRFTKVDTP